MLDTATHTRRSRRPAEVVHVDSKPTGRQIYALCHALVDIAGIDWPETRAAASALIERVSEQRAAILAAAQNGGEFDAGF